MGPNHAIVGYPAICTHRMAYPTRQISFISYRDSPVGASRPNMIHCCSEHSEYDPASGARVVGDPAPQPLSAILLEHDHNADTLHAIGMPGGEVFDAFFEKFEFRLTLDYGASRVKSRVGGQSIVTGLENFCKQRARC